MPANPIITTYDPRMVVVTFGGILIGGYADGTFINITATAERYTRIVGADGEVSRAKSVDYSHEVTLTLLQSSLSNTALSAILQMDRLTSFGILPLAIVDLNGTSLFSWAQAYISKDPDWGYGKDNTDRVWTFQTGNVITDVRSGQVI